MLRSIGDDVWSVESGQPGPTVAVSFGVHGNERPPIEAGLRLVEQFRSGERALTRGRLLLLHANPKASRGDKRWSDGGVDLNRCFHASVLAREPELYEEERARALVSALETAAAEVLVDFHCTVEPGRRFFMQHPPADDEAHRRIRSLLSAEVLLTDPDLHFGSVSLDEWMSTRGRVGICYETGWIQDPENSPEFVLAEMTNLLAGLELIDGVTAQSHPKKELLQLEGVLVCEEAGFVWREGVGENLQAVAAGTVLGNYPSGKELSLERDATLIFPKKRPELVQAGKPVTYLARSVS